MSNINGPLTTNDISITSCKIVGASGQPMEMREVIVELSYFEDIFAFGISGSMLIMDAMNFINILQLRGSEVLILEFDKPGQNTPIKKNFKIFNITNRTQVDHTSQNYVIHFCSEELLLNEQYRISKSFKKSVVSDIVKIILEQNFKISKERIFIDKTSGVMDLIIPNFKPAQAINWMSTFAISTDPKNIGSPFLFYENKYGFNFRSVLNLFKQDIYRSYIYEPKGLKADYNNHVTDMNRELVNVLGYEYLQTFNSISATKNGVLHNKLLTVDPLRLKFGQSEFNYEQYFQEAISLEGNPMNYSNVNRFNDQHKDTSGVVKYAITNTGQSENKYIKDKKITVQENRVESTIPFRTAQLAIFTSNRLKLLVPGDPDLTVGRIILFNMPDMSPTRNGDKPMDAAYSGKYLVTAVRHIINQEGTFVTCIEICKESFPKRYSDFDNTNQSWNSVL